MTTRLTLKQVEGSTKGRWETCRQLRHRHHIGTEPTGRRAIGILSILHALMIREFFLRVRTNFNCMEKKNSNQPTGCVNSTPANTACTELHNISAHFITRTRVAQELEGSGLHAHLCVLKTFVIHVSCFIPCRT